MVITKQTFEQWIKTLDADQVDFILRDYFDSHPSNINGKLIEHYSMHKPRIQRLRRDEYIINEKIKRI